MTVYRGETVKRSGSFVMGRLWDGVEQTEAVRIDFKTAINAVGDSALYADQR
jgi:undecaprenyl pyrophosphate phosphatase UppP